MVSTLGNVFAIGAAAAAGASVITFVRSRWQAASLRKKQAAAGAGSQQDDQMAAPDWEPSDTHPATPGAST